MKFITILFLFLTSQKAFSQTSFIEKPLNCSKNGTEVIYVNGIINTDDDVKAATIKLEFLRIGKLLDQKEKNSLNESEFIHFDYSYNHTHGIVADIFESAVSKLANATDLNRNTIYQIVYSYLLRLPQSKFLLSIEEIIELIDPDYTKTLELMNVHNEDVNTLKNLTMAARLKDRKVIFVSHSQGNLFVNDALSELSRELGSDFQKHYPYIGNLQVASAASHREAKHGIYLTNDKDFIRFVGYESNYDLILPPFMIDPRNAADRFLNHGFLTTYLFGVDEPFIALKKNVIQNLIDVASMLESNCSATSCKDSKGVEYEAVIRTNPDGSDGGLVSKLAVVSTLAIVSKDAVVCGKAFIGRNVKILDKAFIEGSAGILNNSIISGNAIVSGEAIVAGNAVVTDHAYIAEQAFIHQNARVHGNATMIGQSNAYGYAEIGGKALIMERVTISGGRISGYATFQGFVSVRDSVIAYDSAFVENAILGGNARIYGDAFITGTSDLFVNTYGIMTGDSQIYDNAFLSSGAMSGNAKAYGSAKILGGNMFGGQASQNAILYKGCAMYGDSIADGNSRMVGGLLYDNAHIGGTGVVGEATWVTKSGRVLGGYVFGNSTITDNATVSGNATVDSTGVLGNSVITGNAIVRSSGVFGTSYITDNAQLISASVHNAYISGDTVCRFTCSALPGEL